MSRRRQHARDIRRAAADTAYDREHEIQATNGEEYRFRFDAVDADDADGPNPRAGQPSYIARFTKGLPHDDDGFVCDPRDYDDFSEAIESGSYEEFRRVRIGPRRGDDRNRDTDSQNNPPAEPQWHNAGSARMRKWESPTAGHVYDLQGPDAQALALPPAPELDSDELVAEMAEVYAMALLRDLPFSEFAADTDAKDILDALAELRWFDGKAIDGLSDAERLRRRSLVGCDARALFRGLTAGDKTGPLVSQFLLVGTGPRGSGSAANPNGFIDYGALRIDTRVRAATPGRDFMTRWSDWLDVQNGADVTASNEFVDEDGQPVYRHLATPRDLATYVHYDQLYEAYLNAALTLLEIRAPFDRGLPLQDEPTQGGFATFGGPQLLALLTEVSSRALKAVRYQKFNIHRRPRPEAVGGLLDSWHNGERGHGIEAVKPLYDALKKTGLLDRILAHNAAQNASASAVDVDRDHSLLLPMAFAEGSPMHPAYGAGHATVAGACTTILKAWFDCDHPLGFAYQAKADGTGLEPVTPDPGLTVGGELDKLAANISIARNMGGVHYFTDYWESLLLGEKIALGVLEEQKLTYPESFRMTIPPFVPAPSEQVFELHARAPLAKGKKKDKHQAWGHRGARSVHRV